MEQTRFERGMELLDKIDGRDGGAVLRSLEGVAPDLGRYIAEFAFGDVCARPGLSLEEREMITLASLLTAGGCEPQLEVRLSAALNVGLSPEKIVEALLQCVPYAGFPRVLNAVFAAKRVFGERGLLPVGL